MASGKDDEATIRARLSIRSSSLAKALDDLKSKTAEKAKADELSKRSLEERFDRTELQSISVPAMPGLSQPRRRAKKANEQIRLGAEFERVLVLNAKLGLPVWSDRGQVLDQKHRDGAESRRREEGRR